MDRLYYMSCLLLFWSASRTSGEYLESVARVYAEGRSVYLPVKRELLQERIDQLKTLPGGRALYMPDDPVLTNQPDGTHPLLVDISEVTFTDFEEADAGNPESYVSTKGIEVTVTIPYLAISPGGPIDYSLGIAVLYDVRRRGIPQPDFLFRYIPVDRITIRESGVKVKDGDAEIVITLDTTSTCAELYDERAGARPGVVKKEKTVGLSELSRTTKLSKKTFDSAASTLSGTAAELYKKVLQSSKSLHKRSNLAMADQNKRSDNQGALESDLIFSLGSYPETDFCWFYPTGRSDFCDQVDLVQYVVEYFGSNVCLVWTSDNEVYCEIQPGQASVSGWFRHLIPIDEPTEAIAADQFHGDYAIGMKFPCV